MKDFAEKTLWLIPLLPLMGFAINGLAGRRLTQSMPGKWAVAAIACLLPAASFALSVTAVLALRQTGQDVLQAGMTWIQAGAVNVAFGLRVDWLTAVMILVVTGVGTLIHIYSIGYMWDDEAFGRFFAYLNLFMCAMLVLVLADNLLLMFVGWEGVGLCSYLLIGFWYHDLKNADAGKKAFIVNRIGDFGFILGMLSLLGLTGTLVFSDMKGKLVQDSAVLVVPALLLFFGACGKSAQIPLYVWLPDAMAGPTPVSALIHAATMVTAGVYMMGRLHFLYAQVPGATEVIVLVAAATALLAALIAVAQNDIKKILAYSTISQLGFMFAGMASAQFATGIFHLTTHAFFKALLFLGAGAIIHALHGEQDIRKMGGLARPLPGLFILFLAGSLALMGCPGSAGYYSKDAVLTAVASQHGDAFGAAWLILVATAFLTAFYTMRMVMLVFYGAPADEERHPHKPGLTMMIPLGLLALLSVGGGIVLHESLPKTLNAFLGVVKPGEWDHALHRSEIASWTVFGSGAVLAFLIYGLRRDFVKGFVESDVGRPLYKLVANKFYVDELYERTVVAVVRTGAAVLWFLVDRILIDTVLVNGSGRITYMAGALVRRAHTGVIAAGTAAIVLGVIGMMGWLVVRMLG